jgi:hypothetical protein
VLFFLRFFLGKRHTLTLKTIAHLQLFNEVNSRKLNDEYNVFQGILASPIFGVVLMITVAAQFLIMFFMGGIFKVVRLSWEEWLVSVAIGAGSMILSFATRFISRNFFLEAENEERDSAERHTITAIQYREHFWQVMRPPMPKELKELKTRRSGAGGPRSPSTVHPL